MDGFKTASGHKTALSPIYNSIDAFLRFLANVGCVAIVCLTLITVYDVLTRYLNIPKFPGLNSTMVQESEFWAHTILFATVMAYALIRQVHVRIDLVRDMFSPRGKYIMEMMGILIFLLPFSYIAARYCYDYTVVSFNSGEVSPSTIGLTNVWILKSMMVVMFASLILAGISQFCKCVDGLRGLLNEEDTKRVIGGSH